MSEDRLLRELGHLAREEEGAEKARLDERWDRLAAGTLSAEEDAELRALAETSDEARTAYEAFRPLGAEFQARVTEALTAELQRPPETPEALPRILPFPRPVRRLAPWVTAAAAAAGLFFLLRNPMPPLPVYEADELSGGVKTYRGETGDEEPLFFIPSSLLTLPVRPTTSVTGPVEARAYFVRDGEWVSWEPEIKIDDKGSVRVQGQPGELQPGDWRLCVVVGRPGELPSLSELHDAVRAGRTRSNEWQAVFADLHVLERPPP